MPPTTYHVNAGTADRSAASARLEAFSDGVFSIAATLLVLDLASIRRERRWNQCSTRGPPTSVTSSASCTIGAAWRGSHTR